MIHYSDTSLIKDLSDNAVLIHPVNNYFSIEFPDNYRKQKKVRHALIIKYLKENNYSL